MHVFILLFALNYLDRVILAVIWNMFYSRLQFSVGTYTALWLIIFIFSGLRSRCGRTAMQVGLPANCSLELPEPNTKKKQLDSFLYNSPVQTHIKNGSAGSQGVTCLQTNGAIDSYLYVVAGHLLHATCLSFPRPHGKSFNMMECLPAPDVGAWGRPPHQARGSLGSHWLQQPFQTSQEPGESWH